MKTILIGVRRSQESGFAIGMVIFLIAICLSIAVVFLSRSVLNISFTGVHSDSVIADLQMDSAYEEARNFLGVAIDDVRMDGAFQMHPETPSSDSIQLLADVYAGSPSTALEFLKHVIESQAIGPDGQIDPAHPYANFNEAFSTDWTLFHTSSAILERRYSFEARQPVIDLSSGNPSILFQYGYTLEVRAYSKGHYSQASSQEKGLITIGLSRSPFSRFALFRSQNRNQDGNQLVFAGGDTAAQIQEVFSGPVHLNQAPRFYGHPVFLDDFTSSSSQSDWIQQSAANYSCCAVFEGQSIGDQDEMELPTEIFNVVRLAAGDPSQQAAFDNSPVTDAELVNLLRESPGHTLPGDASSVPPGIYIPVDTQSTLNPKGGIYVEGDSHIRLNVVQGSDDFVPDRWAHISPTDQSCKFQKIVIEHLEDLDLSREIYVADDPCYATYVFTPDIDVPPHVLPGRINGNLHVNGGIDQLGGESRTRPAIAQDFGFTISAQKDVRIVNDLQYEDVQYHSIDADGNQSETAIATPWGPVGESSYEPTDYNVVPKVSDASKSVLGILSTHRNVMLHIDAPANLNVHAAILAGNPDAYNASTELGCGPDNANQRGCGFGNEGWNSKTGMGSFKFLGSISEYRSQSMGTTANPPTGYQRRLMYDQRFLQDLVPPAYPLSENLQAVAWIENFRAWRLVQAED